MRLLAAILVLALSVFSASAGNAAPASHAADCQHPSAIPDPGYDHHHGSTTAPADADLACCLLHCVAIADASAGPLLPASALSRAILRAEEHFEGTDIEPAIPPPRG